MPKEKIKNLSCQNVRKKGGKISTTSTTFNKELLIVEKLNEYKDLKIFIDEVDVLGNFVEIEYQDSKIGR